MKMRILILGGAGYIGSVVTNLLMANNFKVKVMDNLMFKKDIPIIWSNSPDYKFLYGDIRDTTIIRKALENVDIIVHMAAIVGDPASKKFPELTRETNLIASKKLINEAVRKKVEHFIFFSTCSNYGIAKGIASENAPLKPLSLYAETKVEVENFLINEVKDLISWNILRLSTVYGSSPRMRFDLTVNDFAMTAYKKGSLEIYLPYSHRPYIHVFDSAMIVLKCINNFEKIKHQVFNVGFEGDNYQKIQIAKLVKKHLPKTKIEIVKAGKDPRDYKVNFSKLSEFFRLKKIYSIEDGVKEVINLLKYNVIENPFDRIYYNE